jgi:hypothetical protein
LTDKATPPSGSYIDRFVATSACKVERNVNIKSIIDEGVDGRIDLG